MKRAACAFLLVIVFVLGLVSIALTGATMDEAKALTEKAAAYWKANGREKAIAEINNPKGQFVKGELYVVAQDFNGVVLANAVNPERVGQNFSNLKDPSGRYFAREMVEAAKKGSGVVEFVFVNPTTKKFQPKTNYVRRVQGEDALVMCGIFH